MPLNEGGPVWAITNARIVPVSGPVIERGTIVVKGNRIQAVGANVSAPSGAKVVDGNGLIYRASSMAAPTSASTSRACATTTT